MAEKTAVELSHWRRHGGPDMAVVFPMTARFFEKAFRWSIKPWCIQHTSTKQTPNTEQNTEETKFLFSFVWAPRG
jgi:hypothetical protein